MRPPMLVTEMIRPERAVRMAGSTARVTRHTPKKLMSSLRRRSSNDVCSSVPEKARARVVHEHIDPPVAMQDVAHAGVHRVLVLDVELPDVERHAVGLGAEPGGTPPCRGCAWSRRP